MVGGTVGLASAVICGFIFLLLPGFLLLRAAIKNNTVAFCASPAISIALYSLEALIFHYARIGCPWVTLFIPLLLVGILAFALSAYLDRRSGVEVPHALASLELRPSFLGLYVIVGILVYGYVCHVTISDPTLFFQEYDNTLHLGKIQGFLESGDWSSMSGNGGFYPSAWHLVAALVVGCSGVEPVVASNATTLLFIVCVLPMGMFLLLSVVFKEKGVVFFGAVSCFAFVAFPWTLLVWGPQYPNLASLCAVPSVAALFFAAFYAGVSKRTRLWLLAFFWVGLIAVTLLHTSNLFLFVIFLVPFAVSKVVAAIPGAKGKARYLRYLLCVAIIFGACAFWVLMYLMPFMRSIVAHVWGPFTTLPQAIVNVLILCYKNTLPQPILGLIVVLGVIVLLVHRKDRWLIVSYLIACVFYIISATTESLPKHLLTGFWYTDQYRLGANAALIAIPFAAVGMNCIAGALAGFISKKRCKEGGSFSIRACRMVLLALFAAVIFYPTYSIPGILQIPSAFGDIKGTYTLFHDMDGENYLDAEELEFADRVKEIVDPSAVIVNVPDDGSAFLYGLNGLNTYYRTFNPSMSKDAVDRGMRLGLNEIAEDESVRDFVQASNIKYVLQLDADEEGPMYVVYNREIWKGIMDIDEETPGFKLILEDGNKRLYEILD